MGNAIEGIPCTELDYSYKAIARTDRNACSPPCMRVGRAAATALITTVRCVLATSGVVCAKATLLYY